MILPISQQGFLGARTVDGEVCIGDTSLKKYVPKYIKPLSNRYKISCGCKTCLNEMLLQSYFNKWRLSQLAKLDKLYEVRFDLAGDVIY